MRGLIHDLRSSVRSLVRSPLFSLAVIGLLALGLGASSAVFALFDALLLRPLDVRDPERLVRLVNHNSAGSSSAFSRTMFEELGRDQHSFEGLFAWIAPALTLDWQDSSESIGGLLLSGEAFEVLGVGAIAGRVLDPADDDPAAPLVAVLTEGYWERRFGRDPSVVGSIVRIHGSAYAIVGVAGRGFAGMQPGMPCELILPLSSVRSIWRRQEWTDPGLSWLQVNALLRPEVSLAQARAELATRWPAILEATEPAGRSPARQREYRGQTIEAVSAARGNSRYQQRFADPLFVLAAVVGLLLLITCLNLANLFLARGSARRRETALRLALGAGRGRVFRQLAMESFLLVGCGAALGLVVAVWAADGLIAMWSAGPGRLILDPRLDLRIFAFTAAAALIAAVPAGLAPAVRTAWGSPASPLRDAGRGAAGVRSRLAGLLIVSQVAFSLALLANAGWIALSLWNLREQGLDFRPEGVLLVSLSPTTGDYGDLDIPSYYDRLLAEVHGIPGVSSAAFSKATPMGYWPSTAFLAEGQAGEARATDASVFATCVSPGFFETVGAPLVLGRDFDARDSIAAPKTAIVNQSFADSFFAGQSPIGGRIGRSRDVSRADLEIVGVVRDRGFHGFRETDARAAYTPCAQEQGAWRRGSRTLVVRAAGAAAVLPAIRERIRARGVELPNRVTTIERQAEQSLVRERSVALLSAGFATLATALVAFGLYALLAFMVRSRTREIGVRLALGAEQGRILRMVLGRAARLAALGVAAGVPLALLGSRYAASLLFGLSWSEPLIVGGAGLLLLIVAVCAAYLPARVASRLEPAAALRHE